MLPAWLQITLAVCSIVVGPLVAHMAAKKGAQRGLDIALAVHETLIKEIQREVVWLREAKHAHAQRITEHAADIHVLKHKAGLT